MKIHALEIPEERIERLRWLEEHLAGIDLPLLVAELRSVHNATAFVSLSQIMADKIPEVLESGLSELDDRRIQQLLRNPDCLFELQEQILLNGSTYWHHLANGQTSDVQVNLDIEKVLSAPRIESPHVKPVALESEDYGNRPFVSPPPTTNKSWFSHPAIVSLATAAALLIATNMFNGFNLIGSGSVASNSDEWGWERPGVLAPNVTPAAYMTKLADSAEEWFNKKPETAQQLATRIGDFRKGCSRLILSEHAALSPDDKDWLIDRCRVWADMLDSQLTAIEAGEPVAEVRSATDDTIKRLVGELRVRTSSLVV